jgi:O-acetylhomoserine (thiol)-lyase
MSFYGPGERASMNEDNPYRFETKVIHAGLTPEQWQGATLPPIFQSASHVHSSAENLSRAFAGKTDDPIYMRLANPTNRALEEKLTILEGGQGALVTSSGMAAISNACMALLRSGDELVAGNSLFMSTYLLFTRVFRKYGITARLVESTDLKALEEAINDRTRMVFLETIGNPKMDVPDLGRAAEIAHRYGIPLLVDNTVATPYLCEPIEHGADVVIHSTTKYLNGHGDAVGGAVIDAGSFDWSTERFPDFAPFVERKANLAFLDKVWREHHINFGTTQSPFHAYLTLIGLDTLALRMERHVANAARVARFLEDQPGVRWVNYPGLDAHPSHERAHRQFGGRGFGGMLTFELKDQAACFRFINSLRLIYHLANLGDCKTLAIHPYSSQYVALDEQTKTALSIAPGMVRLSVGIEAVEDICEDLAQALANVG